MFMSFASRSHKHMFWPLSVALAERGNNVTILSAHPNAEKVPGITEVNPQALHDCAQLRIGLNMFEERHGSKLMNFMQLFSCALECCRRLFKTEEAKELLEQSFDMVIIDELASDCGMGFAYKYNAPFMFLSTPGFYPPAAMATGNPFPTSVVPAMPFAFSDQMSFFQRVANTLGNAALNIARYYITLPLMDAVLKSALGDDVPPLGEFEKNVSVVLVNQHFTVEYPRPLLPNIISVAGLHCKPANKLPSHLEEFMQSSGEHGVIYFSFGSVIRNSDMPEHIRTAFLEAFAELPQKVIWKWEDETLKDRISPNVLLDKWFPQQDILGHPKTRLFITHGGLLSQTEAAYHGVPLLTFPFFGDQDANAARAVNLGFGRSLEITELTKDTLLEEIRILLEDSRYKETMKRTSERFRDQPETPLQRAVFWSEYVLRNKGAYHIRSAARNLSATQYYLIDVFNVLLVVAVALFFLSSYAVRALCYCCCLKSKGNKVKTS